MISIVIRVPLILSLAPEVVVNSHDELVELIHNTTKGVIEGARPVSVGHGYFISTKSFTVEIKSG